MVTINVVWSSGQRCELCSEFKQKSGETIQLSSKQLRIEVEKKIL